MMATRHILIISLVVIVSGCTGDQIKLTETPLQKLEQYLKSKDNDSKYLLRKYWAKKYVREGMAILSDGTPDNEINRNTINYLIRFGDLVNSVSHKKHSMSTDKACVLIIGKNKDNEVIHMNIPYIIENNSWLIGGEILIKYPGKTTPIPKKPNCSAHE